MKDSNHQIARCLNMSDRVEILSELVQGKTTSIDETLFNEVLDHFYTSFSQYCQEMRHTKFPVHQIDATYTEESITFSTLLSNGKRIDRTYTSIDIY